MKTIRKQEGIDKGRIPESKTSFGGALLRFVISVIWLIIGLGVLVAGTYAVGIGSIADELGYQKGRLLVFAGILISVILFILTFAIPYLRKKGTVTRAVGYGALIDALFWIYILITNV